MNRYEIHVTVDADTIQEAINKILYPDGVPVEGVSHVWAEEETV